MNSSSEQDKMINFKCALLTHQVSRNCPALLRLVFDSFPKVPYHQDLETHSQATSPMNAHVAQGGAHNAHGANLWRVVNHVCFHHPPRTGIRNPCSIIVGRAKCMCRHYHVSAYGWERWTFHAWVVDSLPLQL